MLLLYTKDSYAFSVDVGSLTIEPGSKTTTLSRAALEQLGLNIKDDYRIELTGLQDAHGVIDSILAVLREAVARCRGSEEIWMARDLKRAIVLIDGLDEKVVQEILDQEGT